MQTREIDCRADIKIEKRTKPQRVRIKLHKKPPKYLVKEVNKEKVRVETDNKNYKIYEIKIKEKLECRILQKLKKKIKQRKRDR